MAETVVFTSRRAQRAQRIQGGRHALVGVTLAMAGAQAYLDGHGTWPDAVGIVGGALLLAAFVREARTSRSAMAHAPHAHHGIGWVDVFAGLVTAVEAWHLHHQGKHALPFAYAFVAVLLFTIGVLHPRLKTLRRLIVSDEGFDVRMSPWRRVRAAWSDVATLDADGRRVTITMLDGRVERLDFTDAPEADHVVTTLSSAASRVFAAREAAAATLVESHPERPDA